MKLSNQEPLLKSITDYFIASKKFRNFRRVNKKLGKSRMMLPSDINGGECYRWAYFANCLIDCSLYRTFGDTYTHAFIGIENKFYDAECCKGVEDWKELPFFILTANRPWCQEWQDNSVKKETVEDFVKYWSFDPKYVKERVQEYLGSKYYEKIKIFN